MNTDKKTGQPVSRVLIGRRHTGLPSSRYAAENENFVLVVLASAFDSTVCRHSEF
jgi:hypothetical protein